jgi:hypothetical protein
MTDMFSVHGPGLERALQLADRVLDPAQPLSAAPPAAAIILAVYLKQVAASLIPEERSLT